jgi:hypothetical protein
MRLILTAAIAGTLCLLWWTSDRPSAAMPGALAPLPPVQVASERDAPFERDGFTLQPLARFEATAKVLGREDYRLDNESALSPTDLALGWGRMSDPQITAQLDIDQRGRWYHYRWSGLQPPIPLGEIITSSANMHFIPADANAAAALDRVREGQVVRFSGYLVEVSKADGWRWRSSLTREDSGGGACEIVLLEKLAVSD